MEDKAAKTPTLRDIAHHANVSVATVSRALNNKNVDENTRLLVHRAAEALNYPLENLRTQDNRKTIVIASRGDFSELPPGMTTGVDFDELVTRGVWSVLEPDNIRLMVEYTSMRREDSADFCRDFAGDGLIIMGGILDEDFILALQKAGIPFVIAGSHALPIQTNCVVADNMRGAEMAVHHLVERGRTKIGLVNSSTKTRTSDERLRGIRLGLQVHGLSFVPEHISASTEFDLDAGYHQTLQLLARTSTLDAIIYGHDLMAVGGIRALKDRGYHVPDDMAVVGFNNYSISQYTDPPLTTIGFDKQLMGKKAAQLLTSLVDTQAHDDTWHVLMPTELIVRSST